MSIPEESRSLLLEQLESRCMLAGGIFFQVSPRDQAVLDRIGGGDRIDRAASVVGASHNDSHSQRTPSDRQPGDRQASVRGIGQLTRGELPRGQAAAQTPQQNVVPPRASSPSTIIGLIVVPSSPTSGSTRGSTTNDGGGSSSRPEGELDASAGATVDASPATTESATETLVSAPGSATIATQDEVVRPDSRDRERPQAVASDTVSVDQIPESTTSTQTPFDESLTEDVSKTIDVDSEPDLAGTIETLPLSHQHFRESSDLADDPNDDEQWELGGDALERLRDVADGTNDETPDLGRSVIDHAINDWFGESTGLIENIVFEHDLPSMMHDINASMVDVVLDATVGMHRSVGLIAGVEMDLSPDPAGEIRGAVLAVIAREFADSLATDPPPPVQSSGEPNSIRISGIAYPGAAIVASLLAIGSRRWSGKQAEKEGKTPDER
ncbi:hypothetical protein Enr13x_45220 [Stieleria neptunia]|uniref:Uncharacterized protein n=1 Tax=Stieleria neptunia TaxID=2527979 RepID=A0A518HV66_9BACT|nr:hypothetical protein [Stieleria neptunia]QDV44654.1 hypothetical protein Enr13x_45220 [Stieleria neptunia]